MQDLDPASFLPSDMGRSLLVGRVWRPGLGPSVVAVRQGRVVDISGHAATMADLLDKPDPQGLAAEAPGESLGDVTALHRVTIACPESGALVNTVRRSDAIPPWTFGARSLYVNLAQRGLVPAR